MPTYEYECGQCGHKLEAFQNMTAKPLRKCPKCGGRALTRLIGAGAAVLFRGEGFYATDYRSKEYKQKAKDESEASSKSSSNSDKSDKKDA